MVEIDARKLECPKPVLLTKAETDKGTEELRVQVDNEVAVGNVTRFLESAGYEAKREDAPDGKSFFITGRKTGEAAQKSADKKTTAILFASDTLGAESDGLGEVLIKAYLGTIAKADEPPATVALMNAGVKLALPESSTFDTLRKSRRAAQRYSSAAPARTTSESRTRSKSASSRTCLRLPARS